MKQIEKQILRLIISTILISIPTFVLIVFASTLPEQSYNYATNSNTIETIVATPSNPIPKQTSLLKKAIESKSIKNDWVFENGKYYYFDDLGILYKSGIYTIDNNRYYFDKRGVLVTGRFVYMDKEFWANKDGSLYSSTWIDINGVWYYINENGSIFKDGVTPDGYEIDENGHYIVDEDDTISKYSEFDYSNTTSKKELRLNIGTGDIIWTFLKERGWTDTAIAGAMGNFQQESQMSPTLKEKGGTGYGLAQWSFGRKEAMLNWCAANGYSDKSLEAQLEYLLIEPGESSYVNGYSKTDFSSVAEATIAWCKNWERPNMAKAHLGDVRIPYAEAYYAHYVNGENFAVSSYIYEEPEINDEILEEETLATASDANAIPIEERTDENYGPAFTIKETQESIEVGPGIEKETEETEIILEDTEDSNVTVTN